MTHPTLHLTLLPYLYTFKQPQRPIQFHKHTLFSHITPTGQHLFLSSKMDTVMELGTQNPVVIFSKTNCCMSHAIITLIRGFGTNPVEHELDRHPNGVEMEKALMGLGCRPSVPAVFIGKEFVGGSDEIMSLNIRGKLKPLLIKANAIWM